MANQPPTFRYPFSLHGIDPNAAQAHIFTFNAIQDLQQAIQSLKSQLTTTQKNVAGTTNVTNVAGGSSVSFPFPNLGTVNDQQGNVIYLTQQSDNGALIVLGDSSPVALNLNSGVNQPYFAWVTNLDSSPVTITPTTGFINQGLDYILIGYATTEVFFQGSDWWATL